MTKAFQDVSFEPFTRAEDHEVLREGKRDRAGMTITRNLIRMMDGDIKVESEPKRGSKFTVTIHLKLQEEHYDNVEELAGLPVLIVDDDRVTAESACIMLNDIGMQGTGASEGKQSAARLTSIKAKRTYFAVILTGKCRGWTELLRQQSGKISGRIFQLLLFPLRLVGNRNGSTRGRSRSFHLQTII